MLRFRNLDLAKLCTSLLNHSAADVRIASFSLMNSFSKSTAPLPSGAVISLQQCIHGFHRETDPKTRNEYIALTKLLRDRLEKAVKTFLRLSSAAGKPYQDFAGAGENLMQHINLARWYQQYLWNELRPTASYQSHITALKILPLIFCNTDLTSLNMSNRQHPVEAEQSENRSGGGNIIDHVRPLLDLLGDPFDDVRQSAFEALCLIVPSTFYSAWMYRSNDSIDVYIRTNQVAQVKLVRWVELGLAHAKQHLQRTGRADHADGVGRLYNLYDSISTTDFCPASIEDKDPLYNLLAALEQSSKTVGQKLSGDKLGSTPLHGYLIAMR